MKIIKKNLLNLQFNHKTQIILSSAFICLDPISSIIISYLLLMMICYDVALYYMI